MKDKSFKRQICVLTVIRPSFRQAETATKFAAQQKGMVKMAFLNSLNISGSALTAQKFRMEVISQNIANADTNAGGKAYRRKLVTLSERKNSFTESLNNASKKIKTENAGGVEVSGITEDDNAVKFEYDPDNPLANDEGYVEKPDINTVEEMVDMMSASRSYEANITAFNAVKQMATKALDIGK